MKKSRFTYWLLPLAFAVLHVAIVFGQQSQVVHVVQKGETFASIAEKYGVSESELRRANPNANTFFVGMKLSVKPYSVKRIEQPAKGSTKPSLPQNSAPNPSMKIDKIWTTFDVTQNGEKGMLIHVDFQAYNLKGKTIDVVAIFYNANKQNLVSNNARNQYRFADTGTLKANTLDKIIYDTSKMSDLRIFIPYSQFPSASGKQNYFYKVFISYDNKWLPGNSDFQSFNITWPFQRQIVKTWRENTVNGYNIKTKYNDGWVKQESHNKCPSAYCYNGNCTHQGMYSYMNCPICRYTNGKCAWCKGSGEQVQRYEFLEANGYYGSINDCYLVTISLYMNMITHNHLVLSDRGQITDKGTYWMIGNVALAKDMSNIVVNNKTYYKMSQKDVQEYVARSIRNYIPPATNGSFNTSPIHLENKPQSIYKKCSICNGSGNCSYCGGDGKRRLGDYGRGEEVDCTICNGTGKCGHCYGSGELPR